MAFGLFPVFRSYKQCRYAVHVSAFVFSKISKKSSKMVLLICTPSELGTVPSCLILWENLHQIETNCLLKVW